MSPVDALIRRKGTLAAAVTLPNLPPALPKGSEGLGKGDVVVPPGDYDSHVAQCYASFNATSLYGGNSQVFYAYSPKIKSLGPLAPAQPAMQPAACPTIICKTRPYLDMSSVGFKVNAAGAAPAVFNVRASEERAKSGGLGFNTALPQMLHPVPPSCPRAGAARRVSVGASPRPRIAACRGFRTAFCTTTRPTPTPSCCGTTPRSRQSCCGSEGSAVTSCCTRASVHAAYARLLPSCRQRMFLLLAGTPKSRGTGSLTQRWVPLL